jgi:hypothetical protein
MKKTMAAMIATIFLVSLLGCAVQIADKAAWDEQTQKTWKAQQDEQRQRRISGP